MLLYFFVFFLIGLQSTLTLSMQDWANESSPVEHNGISFRLTEEKINQGYSRVIKLWRAGDPNFTLDYILNSDFEKDKPYKFTVPTFPKNMTLSTCGYAISGASQCMEVSVTDDLKFVEPKLDAVESTFTLCYASGDGKVLSPKISSAKKYPLWLAEYFPKIDEGIKKTHFGVLMPKEHSGAGTRRELCYFLAKNAVDERGAFSPCIDSLRPYCEDILDTLMSNLASNSPVCFTKESLEEITKKYLVPKGFSAFNEEYFALDKICRLVNAAAALGTIDCEGKDEVDPLYYFFGSFVAGYRFLVDNNTRCHIGILPDKRKVIATCVGEVRIEDKAGSEKFQMAMPPVEALYSEAILKSMKQRWNNFNLMWITDVYNIHLDYLKYSVIGNKIIREHLNPYGTKDVYSLDILDAANSKPYQSLRLPCKQSEWKIKDIVQTPSVHECDEDIYALASQYCDPEQNSASSGTKGQYDRLHEQKLF
jgi:hypothetical protein